jgi:hypothetical protein
VWWFSSSLDAVLFQSYQLKPLMLVNKGLSR